MKFSQRISNPEEKIQWDIKFIDEDNVRSVLYDSGVPIFEFEYDSSKNPEFSFKGSIGFKTLDEKMPLTYHLIIKKEDEKIFKYATEYRDAIRRLYINSFHTPKI